MLIIIIKALFFDKIYIHKFFGFMDLMTELTVTLYLIIGMISRFYGAEKIDRNLFERM